MTDELVPDADPQTIVGPPEGDEEEAAWQRLSPRLRELYREELEAHEERRAAAAAAQQPTPTPAAPAQQPTQEDTTPSDDHRPRRRTASEFWFGRRR